MGSLLKLQQVTWVDVGCLHTLSPVQYSNRAPQEQQVSFEARQILNNWLFLCCSPSWEHIMKPAWVVPLKIQFYEMIGVQHEGYKNAQVEVKPFSSVKTSPVFQGFVLTFWSPDSA